MWHADKPFSLVLEGATRQVKAVKLCSFMTKSSSASTTGTHPGDAGSYLKTAMDPVTERRNKGERKYHRAFLPGVRFLLLMCLLSCCTTLCTALCLYVQINALKFPVLLSCPLPGPLAEERRLFMAFLIYICWHFQVSGFSRTHLGYMRQKKAQGTHCSIIPEAPSS